MPNDTADEEYLSLRKTTIQKAISSKRNLNLKDSNNNNIKQLNQEMAEEDIGNITIDLFNNDITCTNKLEQALVKLSEHYAQIGDNSQNMSSINHSEICQRLHAVISLYKSNLNIIVNYITYITRITIQYRNLSYISSLTLPKN